MNGLLKGTSFGNTKTYSFFCLPPHVSSKICFDWFIFFSEKPKIKWAGANTRRNAKSSHWTDSDSFPSYTTHLNYSTHLNAAAAAAAANGCETKHICETVRDNHMLLKEAADMKFNQHCRSLAADKCHGKSSGSQEAKPARSWNTIYLNSTGPQPADIGDCSLG